LRQPDRVNILVGAPFIPVNSFDNITSNRLKSDVKMLENMIANLVQSAERVKDPKGVVASACLMLGVQFDTAYFAFTQGTNKEVKILDYGFVVTCDEALPKPKIYPWIDKSDTIRRMRKHLSTGSKIKNLPNIVSSLSASGSMSLDKKVAGNFSKNKNICWKHSNCLTDKCYPSNLVSFFNVLLYIIRTKKVRNLNEFEQLDSRFFEKNPARFSSNDMKVDVDSEDNFPSFLTIPENLDKSTCVVSESQYIRHKTGKEPIKIEIVSKDNMVNFILFDGIGTKEDLGRLLERLAQLKDVDCCPIVTFDPKSETFGAWILMEPINAKVAKTIAREIKEEVKKKHKIKLNCNIYPNYTSYESAKRHSTNEISLPLYAGAQILVNGQFVDNTDELTVRIHDFSGLTELIEKF
jgi:hypothetical protein